MSATIKTADFEVGSVAHVTFRVRCETLGHGEEVFLVAEGDKGMQKVGIAYLVAARAVRVADVRTNERSIKRSITECFVPIKGQIINTRMHACMHAQPGVNYGKRVRERGILLCFGDVWIVARHDRAGFSKRSFLTIFSFAKLPFLFPHFCGIID